MPLCVGGACACVWRCGCGYTYFCLHREAFTEGAECPLSLCAYSFQKGSLPEPETLFLDSAGSYSCLHPVGPGVTNFSECLNCYVGIWTPVSAALLIIKPSLQPPGIELISQPLCSWCLFLILPPTLIEWEESSIISQHIHPHQNTH